MYKVTERKITKSDLEEDGTNEGREAHLKLLGQIDFTGIYFIFFQPCCAQNTLAADFS